MKPITRAFLVILIWGATSVAWLTLGGVTLYRSGSHGQRLKADVDGLWGQPQTQRAPSLRLLREGDPGATSAPAPSATGRGAQTTPPTPSRDVSPSASEIAVDLALDQRQRGLTWFSLYDVTFDGTWTFDVPARTSEESGRLEVQLPAADGVYDDFHVWVDGAEREAVPAQGVVSVPIENILLDAGEPIAVRVRYKSRGQDLWAYSPSAGSASLRNFSLHMTTDFDKIDFPEGTLSPSTRTPRGGGAELEWAFSNIVTQRGIGMTMPQRIQPGELASQLSFSAPISLGFFFLVIAVLAKLKELEVHPVNYLMLGAAFFSFHLLFAYSVDLLPLAAAFALSSVVSVAMVTSYLRLVVSARFGFVQAGIAQLVYLIGFSLAHFFAGLTGLTVTVLSIATLFLLMLLTGRIRWATVFDRPALSPVPMGPFRDAPHAPTTGTEASSAV